MLILLHWLLNNMALKCAGPLTCKLFSINTKSVGPLYIGFHIHKFNQPQIKIDPALGILEYRESTVCIVLCHLIWQIWKSGTNPEGSLQLNFGGSQKLNRDFWLSRASTPLILMSFKSQLYLKFKFLNLKWKMNNKVSSTIIKWWIRKINLKIHNFDRNLFHFD